MAGVAAFGTKLKVGGTAGTAIVNITELNPPEQSAEELDMTAHDSGGAYREIVPSFLSAGKVTLTINWDPNATTHKNGAGGLRKLFADRTKSSFAIEYPVTPVAHDIFDAYVTGFQPSAPFDDKLTAQVTLSVSGAPTLA